MLYNSAQHLAACLEAVRGLPHGTAEVVLVDNASPDSSVLVGKDVLPSARVIRSDRNRGFAGGVNLAWPHVQGRYWLLLNPDVELTAEGLTALVDWMDARPYIGVASPSIVRVDGEREYVARRFPSMFRSLVEVLRLHKLLPERRRGALLLGPYWSRGDNEDVDWVSGTVMIARREAVDTVGLLSEEYFMYGEDVEWCWRMRRAGWRVGLCDGVSARHHVGGSARETWDVQEWRDRWLAGYYQFCAQAGGRVFARGMNLVNILAMAIEAVHPRRTVEERQRFRTALRQHCRMLGRPLPRRLAKREA